MGVIPLSKISKTKQYFTGVLPVCFISAICFALTGNIDYGESTACSTASINFLSEKIRR
jgi:hypothetical protein